MPYARKAQLVWLPGCYYHFYNRGARQVTIFPADESYVYALRKLKEYSRELAVQPIAYCLLPNHYHILVRQDGDQPAGLLPQRLFNSYSKAYNKRFKHSGTLFERRYNARMVTKTADLCHLCLYIHANPLKHSVATQVGLWPFSNYPEWVGERHGTLYDKGFVNAHFSGAASYRQTMDSYVRSQRFLNHDIAEGEKP